MPQFTLSILRHDQSSDLLTFEKTSVLIGREGGDIVTGDPQMSNRHAQFTFSGGVLMFEDLVSTNGSFLVSGERIATPIPVSPGTALKMGSTTITVQDVQTGYERGGTAVMPQAMPPAPASPPTPTPAAVAQPGATAAPKPAPKPAQENSRGPAAEAVAMPVDPHASPESAGLLGQFKFYLSTAADIYKQHYLGGVLTIGLVAVPAALLQAFFGLIPAVGWLLALLVGLAQLALTPISAGAMGRWALATASGRSLTWQDAWKAALKNPVGEWLNVAVMMFITGIGTMVLIVPGIILGMFALPAYLLEEKRFIGINLRSAELVLKDPARHIGLALLAMLLMVPVMIAAGIVGYILVYVPLIGGPLSAAVSVAFSVAVVPFIYLLWSLVYFDVRKRLEGQGPEQVQATLDSWSA